LFHTLQYVPCVLNQYMSCSARLLGCKRARKCSSRALVALPFRRTFASEWRVFYSFPRIVRTLRRSLVSVAIIWRAARICRNVHRMSAHKRHLFRASGSCGYYKDSLVRLVTFFSQAARALDYYWRLQKTCKTKKERKKVFEKAPPFYFSTSLCRILRWWLACTRSVTKLLKPLALVSAFFGGEGSAAHHGVPRVCGCLLTQYSSENVTGFSRALSRSKKRDFTLFDCWDFE